ncbi:phosphoglycerate mutase domain-containing protein [Cavenderia fasciculata]|uniref:phosphoglycerate mutase (2,3-diphosphoglycerate-dependent) n=1 Tax=Cavenderia fasciculata TaxID=261658 RepID=F4Q1T9_CACFS|nr:phosphoglycerate mutase domain-containing protein [Cavenderia fasciculata]EGG17959.1 phosphoglycerate mutase domain-containing protein [Cavenderia fasciculata]|eukprot:XP_004356851.1 phosphoglycerate mutase domain-containing protein [Cavenderia fasciculata]
MSDIAGSDHTHDIDFHLPEEKKTEKRLISDVDDEEQQDEGADDERSNNDVDDQSQATSYPSSDLLSPIEFNSSTQPAIQHLHLQSPQMISSSSTTTTTTTTQQNSSVSSSNTNNTTSSIPQPSPKFFSTSSSGIGGLHSPKSFSSFPPPLHSSPSSLSTGTGAVVMTASQLQQQQQEIESDSEYFSGRRVIAESGSDISGNEADISSQRIRKKKRTMRKEGKIYELLEQRLGREVLRNIQIGAETLKSSAQPPFDWPFELVLVRHGQSEGNEAQSRSKRGDLSAYTPEFKKKHSSTYRLTDKGILQAKIAGRWVRENVAEVFDRYYTSEYVRAMETASLLGLQEAQWLTEIQLRERDKGKMDNISWTEKNEKFGIEMELRKRDSFFWAPPGGESIASICSRVEHTFTTLRRECANKRVVIVCHGEIMWAFRVRLERLSQIRFHQLQSSKDPRDQIHNTSILWYTRVHPKSVCPWKPEYSAPGWLEFDRPIYTNEELMESVRTVPRFVNNLDQ